MPKPIKATMFVLVLVIALSAYLLRDAINLGVELPVLAPIAVFVVWALRIFPEPARGKPPGGRG